MTPTAQLDCSARSGMRRSAAAAPCRWSVPAVVGELRVVASWAPADPPERGASTTSTVSTWPALPRPTAAGEVLALLVACRTSPRPPPAAASAARRQRAAGRRCGCCPQTAGLARCRPRSPCGARVWRCCCAASEAGRPFDRRNPPGSPAWPWSLDRFSNARVAVDLPFDDAELVADLLGHAPACSYLERHRDDRGRRSTCRLEPAGCPALVARPSRPRRSGVGGHLPTTSTAWSESRGRRPLLGDGVQPHGSSCRLDRLLTRPGHDADRPRRPGRASRWSTCRC